jgi:hypothetical protein
MIPPRRLDDPHKDAAIDIKTLRLFSRRSAAARVKLLLN